MAAAAAAIANQNPIIPQRLSKHPSRSLLPIPVALPLSLSLSLSTDRKATVESRGHPGENAQCLISRKVPRRLLLSSEAKLRARAPSLSHIRVRADTSVSSFESLNPPPSPLRSLQCARCHCGLCSELTDATLKIFSNLDIYHVDFTENAALKKHLL